ncbi:Na(+)-translocating NADH-quinone reductase subunit A [Thermopirellula anaerolimosa]
MMLRLLEERRTVPVQTRMLTPRALPARTIVVRRGLDLPIAGVPIQRIHDAEPVARVALLGSDYHGLKPRLLVTVGDWVREGQTLWIDKHRPGIRFAAPAGGFVSAVIRGAKRRLIAVVIDVSDDRPLEFPMYDDRRLEMLDEEEVRLVLQTSGMWTALRMRPFGRVPSPDETAEALFVTAMDTHPLSARPSVVLKDRAWDFHCGLRVLARLSAPRKFVCVSPDEDIPGTDVSGWETVAFAGPHPAGLPGTHIHFLSPVNRQRTAWYLGYQDVAAIGRLFITGTPDHTRVVALGGPAVAHPRLLRTRLGADLSQILRHEVLEAKPRVISGSVLGGQLIDPAAPFLGRYHTQVSVLPGTVKREFFGWLAPGFGKFSVSPVTVGAVLGKDRLFAMHAGRHGGKRAVFPIGNYEKVMPLDILPTFLLRALENGDLEESEALGCLELEEEDLALCSFVCPGKQDYGTMLRGVLTAIERDE